VTFADRKPPFDGTTYSLTIYQTIGRTGSGVNAGDTANGGESLSEIKNSRLRTANRERVIMERRTRDEAILDAIATAKVARSALTEDASNEVVAIETAQKGLASHAAEIVALHVFEGGEANAESVRNAIENMAFAGPAKTIGEQTSRACRVLGGFPATAKKKAKAPAPNAPELVEQWSQRNFETPLDTAYRACVAAEITAEERLLKAVDSALKKFAKEEGTTETIGCAIVQDHLTTQFSVVEDEVEVPEVTEDAVTA